MKFQKSLLGLAVLTAMQSAMASEVDTNPVVVSSSRYAVNEYNATFATEIYTAQDITDSGATSLYDFLGQDTSIDVLPYYGNPFSQAIDMRGYGIGVGYQNIVVTVDGQRLNNIDGVPQLLSSIPISNIQRIEITKGSGSVQYGDGAMAGAIHIITKNGSGFSIGAGTGNYGLNTSKLSAGTQTDKFSINAVSERYHLDGYSNPDVNGYKDSSDSHNLNAEAKYFATDSLELRLGGTQTNISTNYPGPLTLAEFQADPAQNGGNTYNRQTLRDNNSSGGFTYDITPELRLVYDQHLETKNSDYLAPYAYSADYRYASSDLAVKYHEDNTNLIIGNQKFDGTRFGSTNDTSKNNNGLYVQSSFAFGASSISAGLRKEDVQYSYAPTSGTALTANNNLQAYDLGFNHKIDAQKSWFANFNHAFQAPDIDRFFDYGGTFNSFIAPAISNNLNLGISKFDGNYSLKLSAFYADLHNEIYYDALSYTNTNIAKSHKYGMEAQLKAAITDKFSTKLNYTYTKAIIDSDTNGSGAYNGKNLPGVPEHNLNLSFKYAFSHKSSFTLGHVYRSEAYAADDFANSFSQKQAAYNSTNLDYRYTLKNTTLYARVENLFAVKNGMWIQDDAIYPVNFKRTWQIGFNSKF